MKPILLILFAAIASAQTPDCPPVAFNLTANGVAPTSPPAQTPYFDNRQQQCETWTVAYEATGLTGYTVAFQSSVGANTPSSFGAYTGTTVASSASFGTAATGLATYTNINTSSGTVNTPWIRVSVSGASGTGVVRGVFYGYRTGPTGGTGGGGGGGGGGSGCPGTTGTPCVVVGAANAGSVPSGAPVQVGGSDGTDIRTIKTDASGDTLTLGIGAAAFGSGQQAVTASAANLGSQATKFICVKAAIGNTINVYVGPTGVTTSTGAELTPGQPACAYVANTNLLFVVASTTGASVSWFFTD